MEQLNFCNYNMVYNVIILQMAGMFDLCKMQNSRLFLVRAAAIYFLNIQNNQVLHLSLSKW